MPTEIKSEKDHTETSSEMPHLWHTDTTNIVAIICSDIHLQAKPPRARSIETDWFAAMQRPLDEIAALMDIYDAPLVVAGDIFDKWNASPEVINFALQHLPFCYAVPGQHDLPNHDYNQIERSAYWTLVEAGKIINLKPDKIVCPSGNVMLQGFPWGTPLRPIQMASQIDIAVCHHFIWSKAQKTGYPGADNSSRVGKLSKQLDGFDVKAFGDNHKGFTVKDKGVLNCGSLMRRNIDQFEYEPHVGLITNKGEIVLHFLDTIEDEMILSAEESSEEETLDLGRFVDELAAMGTDALNFTESVNNFLRKHDIEKEVKSLIRSWVSPE